MARICLIWVLFSLFVFCMYVVCFLPFSSQKVVFPPAKRNKFVYKTLQVMWFDIPLRLAVPLYSPEDTAWKSFKQRQILWRLTLESHWDRRIACVARARKGKKGNRASPVPVSPSPFERLPRKLGLLREWRLTIREIKWTSQRPQQTQNLLYVYIHCFIRKYWIPTSVIGGVSHHKHHNEAVFNWVSKLIHVCFTFASKPMAVFTLRTYTSRRMVHLVRLC